MDIIEKARATRAIIERAVVSLDDKTASEAPELAQGMRMDGSLIRGGTRINWRGKLLRAAVDLWDTPENAPDKAPTLWEEIPYRDGIRIIPQVITAGTAFAKGEKGWWGNVVYVSIFDGKNLWTPDVRPEGWRKEEA